MANISGLQLDQASKDAIKRIHEKQRLGNLLGAALSAGVVINIFARSQSWQASYNITQTDWSLYGQAMKSVPVITRAAIRKEVELMILHYHTHQNYRLLQFWEGVYEGL